MENSNNSNEKTRLIDQSNAANPAPGAIPNPTEMSVAVPTELDQERPPGAVREIDGRVSVDDGYDTTKTYPTPTHDPSGLSGGTDSLPTRSVPNGDATSLTDLTDHGDDSSDPKTQLISRIDVAPKPAGDSGSSAGLDDPPVGCLLICGGPGVGNYRILGMGHNTIGRGDENRVVMDFGDGSISSEKALSIVYEPRENRYFVRAAEGINLAYLGGNAIMETTELKGGEEIQLGQTMMKFIPFCIGGWTWASVTSH